MTIDVRLRDATEQVFKALGPLNVLDTPEGRTVLASIMVGIAGAYEAGVKAMVEFSPWEIEEVAYRDRVTPKMMLPMTSQGWEPWALSQTLVPSPIAKSGHAKGPSVDGWLVRYKRRVLPVEEKQS